MMHSGQVALERGLSPKALEALGDPQRLQIVRLVRDEALPSGDIARHFRTTPLAILQDLRILAEARLIELSRNGKIPFYKVRTAGLSDLQMFLKTLSGEKDEASTGLALARQEPQVLLPPAPGLGKAGSRPRRLKSSAMNDRSLAWQNEGELGGEVLPPVLTTTTKAKRIVAAVQRILSDRDGDGASEDNEGEVDFHAPPLPGRKDSQVPNFMASDEAMSFKPTN